MKNINDNNNVPVGLSFSNPKNIMFAGYIQNEDFDIEEDEKLLSHVFGGTKNIYKNLKMNESKNNLNKSFKRKKTLKKNKTFKKN